MSIQGDRGMRTDKRARYEVMNMGLQAVIYNDDGSLDRIEKLYQFRSQAEVKAFWARWYGPYAQNYLVERHSIASFEAKRGGFYALVQDMAGKTVYRTRLYETIRESMEAATATAIMIEEENENI